MSPIEKAKSAIREIMGPVIVHPEASAEIIARQRKRQEDAADSFARAAILAFLEGVEKNDTIWQALDNIDDDDTSNTQRARAVLAALRAQAGESHE